MMNLRRVKSWPAEELGQDLIECTLLMAFVALASAGLFVNSGTSVQGIWTTTASQLAKGAPCTPGARSVKPCN
jgi:Flp pilus assembly pilin Flp